MGLAGTRSGGEGTGPAGAADNFSPTGKGSDSGAALEESRSDDGAGIGGLDTDAKGGWVNIMLGFFGDAADWIGAESGATGVDEGAEGGATGAGGGDPVGGFSAPSAGSDGGAGTGGLDIDAKGGWVNIILGFFCGTVGAAAGWAGEVEDTGPGTTGLDEGAEGGATGGGNGEGAAGAMGVGAAGLAAGAAGGVTTLRRSGCLDSSLIRLQANDFPAKRNQKDSLAVQRGMGHVSAKLSHKPS